ncbi:septal ring lytic transglycosylase RlpA family protein [Taklimakanibacter deserti]|uniref:septal ring lytic transglycosylase RlpA family protein n=1 Tax=Taklimakanibacter deserti TaxID=2267839 RepID=UPI000E654221
MRQLLKYSAVFIAIGLIAAGCSSSKKKDPFAGIGSPYYSKAGPLPKGGGRYHVGKPYEVAGVWFTPKEQPGYDKVGIASWYGPQFHRRMTSNGEWFDMNELTAAHATLPLPSYAKVTNLQNGRSVVVRVNDRGPFVDTRIIDMSRRSAELLAFKPQGMAKVRVQYIGPAPLNDQGQHLAAMNRELRNGTPLNRMMAAAEGWSTGETEVAAVDQGFESYPTVQTNIASASTAYETPDYFVQVGSFADPYNAERAREELANSGPVEVQELMGSQGPLYRVRIGPMKNQGQAQLALRQAVDLGHPDARLIMANAAL